MPYKSVHDRSRNRGPVLTTQHQQPSVRHSPQCPRQPIRPRRSLKSSRRELYPCLRGPFDRPAFQISPKRPSPRRRFPAACNTTRPRCRTSAPDRPDEPSENHPIGPTVEQAINTGWGLTAADRRRGSALVPIAAGNYRKTDHQQAVAKAHQARTWVFGRSSHTTGTAPSFRRVDPKPAATGCTPCKIFRWA